MTTLEVRLYMPQGKKLFPKFIGTAQVELRDGDERPKLLTITTLTQQGNYHKPSIDQHFFVHMEGGGMLDYVCVNPMFALRDPGSETKE